MRNALISVALLGGAVMCVGGAYAIHWGLAGIILGGATAITAIMRGLRQ